MTPPADLEPDFARDIFGSAFDISGGGIATISQSAWAGVFIIAFLIAFVRGVFWFWRMGTTTQPTVVNEGKGNLLQIVRGVLVVVGLPLLVFSLNPDMLRATFAIPAIRGLQLVGQGVTSTSGGSGTVSSSCEATNTTITRLSSQEGFCGSASCTALSGCSYQQYETIIREEASASGVNPNIVIAIMCQESKAKASAQAINKENGGSFDCGLMQINQKSACSAAIMEPRANIKEGVRLIAAKLAATSQGYPGFSRETLMFASYNCCGNGDNPNAKSGDCTQASGFPFTPPKWACPINPGNSSSNMCSVKNYACGLTACVKQLDSRSR